MNTIVPKSKITLILDVNVSYYWSDIMPFTAAEGGQGDSPAEKKGICCNKITINV